MMNRYIDADALVTVCLYDDEHEERYTERMSIGKCLDLLTEEGCPKTADRPQDDEFKNFDREDLILLIECQKERIGELLADRPQGKWIRDRYWSRGTGMGEEYGFFYKCSMCEYEVESGYTRCGFNFCPYCGADMRKGADDE